MKLITVKEQKPKEGKWYLVRCPEYSESGYEVAEYKDGEWYDGSSRTITSYIEYYNPEYLDC